MDERKIPEKQRKGNMFTNLQKAERKCVCPKMLILRDFHLTFFAGE